MKNTIITTDDSETVERDLFQMHPKRRSTDKTTEGTGKSAPKRRKSRATGEQQSDVITYSEPEVVGGHEPLGKTRKRHHNRRRKGEIATGIQQQSPHHSAVDADELVSLAWKIFKGEVTEEGLALMDDQTAVETARRAFRVAELFLVEAAAHRSVGTRQ